MWTCFHVYLTTVAVPLLEYTHINSFLNSTDCCTTAHSSLYPNLMTVISLIIVIRHIHNKSTDNTLT